jgi:V/A-type H+/Na+-transporting ATPase subunit G/H
MSTAEKYVHSLKQIKEAEDKTQAQIEEHKKQVSEEFRNFESYVSKAIAAAKTDGEKLVESNVEQSRKKATTETEKIIDDANNKSKTVSARIDTHTVQEIIDILLKGV